MMADEHGASETSGHRILMNVRWGVRCGLTLGITFSLLALAVVLVAGTSGFTKVHTTVWAFIALYLVGGLVSGALVGLLRPLVRWRAGSLVVGILAAAPIALALRFMADGFARPWDHFATELVVSFSVIVGGGCGLGWWRSPAKVRAKKVKRAHRQRHGRERMQADREEDPVRLSKRDDG